MELTSGEDPVRTFDLDSVSQFHTLPDVGQPVDTPYPTPSRLGGQAELEHERQHIATAYAALGPVAAMTDSRETCLDTPT